MAKRKDEITDEPIADLKNADRAVDPPMPEPQTDAAARLRAFEDEMLGKDAVRIDGKIERGVGSPYANLTDEQRKKYEALERLIVAEQKIADAHAALIQAEDDHNAAEAAVNG